MTSTLIFVKKIIFRDLTYENLKQGREIQGHFFSNTLGGDIQKREAHFPPTFTETETNPNINYTLGNQSPQDYSGSRKWTLPPLGALPSVTKLEGQNLEHWAHSIEIRNVVQFKGS